MSDDDKARATMAVAKILAVAAACNAKVGSDRGIEECAEHMKAQMIEYEPRAVLD